MNTYPFHNHSGKTFAFEIESSYIGVNKVASLLRSIQGVSDIRMRKLFSSPGDIHVEFIYMNEVFIVWEPYADSSRYWIGPKNENSKNVDIDAIERVFRQYCPHFVLKFFGDLVSLKFLR